MMMTEGELGEEELRVVSEEEEVVLGAGVGVKEGIRGGGVIEGARGGAREGG